VISFDKLPPNTKTKQALLKGLETGHLPWRFLSKKLKQNVEAGLAALKSHNVVFHEAQASVQDQHTLWMEWACKYPEKTTEWDQTTSKVPTEIRWDVSMILKVAKTVPAAARVLVGDVVTREVIEQLLADNPATLSFLPWCAYSRFPDILVNREHILAYLKTEGSNINDLRPHMPPSVWYDIRFVFDWIEWGGDIVHRMSPSIRNSRRVFLKLCDHTWPKFNYSRRSSFKLMSQRLEDKSFVLQLYEKIHAKYFYEYISPALKTNRSVPMAVCANSPRGSLHQIVAKDVRIQFKKRLERDVKEFRAFFVGILCGVEDAESPLHVLDQGPDYSIKEMIASYLSLRISRHFFVAATNLNRSFHPYNDRKTIG